MVSATVRLLVHVVVVLAVLALALWMFSLTTGQEHSVGNLVLRSQGDTTYPLEPPAAESLTHLGAEAALIPPEAVRPTNIIVILGDGMGVGMVSVASELLSPPGERLAMEGAEAVGLMHTWAANRLSTDSAAAATSMATGHKTDKGVLGLGPDGRVLRSIFERAHDGGVATGMVTTSGLADATPGGFLAHVPSRNDYAPILEDVIESGTDVIIGGDFSKKDKAWRDDAYRDLVERAEERGAQLGYTVVRDLDDPAAARGPLLALLPPRPEMPLQHGPQLVEMAEKALDLLEATGRPYLALIETEVIDEAGHDNDIRVALSGMRELDETVARVLERVAPRNDTLVLVASDHETGGPHLLEGYFDDREVVVRWAHDYHSPELVPIFAFGPCASAFSGVLDNTEFGVRIGLLLGLDTEEKLADSQPN